MDGMFATALTFDGPLTETRMTSVERVITPVIYERLRLNLTLIGKVSLLPSRIAFAIPQLSPHEILMHEWAQALGREIEQHPDAHPDQIFTVHIRTIDCNVAEKMPLAANGITRLVAMPIDGTHSSRGNLPENDVHRFGRFRMKHDMVIVTAYPSYETEEQMVDTEKAGIIRDELFVDQLLKLHGQMGKIIARATAATMQSPTAQIGLILALHQVTAMGEQLHVLKNAIAIAKNIQSIEVTEGEAKTSQSVRSLSRDVASALEQAIPHLPSGIQAEMRNVLMQLREAGVTAESAKALPQGKAVPRINATKTATAQTDTKTKTTLGHASVKATANTERVPPTKGTMAADAKINTGVTDRGNDTKTSAPTVTKLISQEKTTAESTKAGHEATALALDTADVVTQASGKEGKAPILMIQDTTIDESIVDTSIIKAIVITTPSKDVTHADQAEKRIGETTVDALTMEDENAPVQITSTTIAADMTREANVLLDHAAENLLAATEINIRESLLVNDNAPIDTNNIEFRRAENETGLPGHQIILGEASFHSDTEFHIETTTITAVSAASLVDASYHDTESNKPTHFEYDQAILAANTNDIGTLAADLAKANPTDRQAVSLEECMSTDQVARSIIIAPEDKGANSNGETIHQDNNRFPPSMDASMERAALALTDSVNYSDRVEKIALPLSLPQENPQSALLERTTSDTNFQLNGDGDPNRATYQLRQSASASTIFPPDMILINQGPPSPTQNNITIQTQPTLQDAATCSAAETALAKDATSTLRVVTDTIRDSSKLNTETNINTFDHSIAGKNRDIVYFVPVPPDVSSTHPESPKSNGMSPALPLDHAAAGECRDTPHTVLGNNHDNVVFLPTHFSEAQGTANTPHILLKIPTSGHFEEAGNLNIEKNASTATKADPLSQQGDNIIKGEFKAVAESTCPPGCNGEQGCCSLKPKENARPEGIMKKEFAAAAESTCPPGCNGERGCCSTSPKETGDNRVSAAHSEGAGESTPIPTCPAAMRMVKMFDVSEDPAEFKQRMADQKAARVAAAAAKYEAA